MAHTNKPRSTASGRIAALFLVSALLAGAALAQTVVTSAAAGSAHTCALTTDGAVKCWGKNDNGQVGDNSTTQRPAPADVSGLSSGVVALAAGGNHTCALTSGGGVKCWGLNNPTGQVGDNTIADKDEPADVNGLASGVAAITAGGNHSCALTTAGGVKCWGDNSSRQLGDNQASGAQSSVPVDVSGLTSGTIAVAAGGNHACALTNAGGVKCWGDNSFGQLGDNQVSGTVSGVPVDVSGLSSGVVAIALGFNFSCALTSTGGIKCWGLNLYGQLGNNKTSSDPSLVPVDVLASVSPSVPLTGVAAITAGERFACAVLTSGAMKCWGLGVNGQLGNDNNLEFDLPVDVESLSTPMASAVAGYTHACAVSTYGALRCWGEGANGQLGQNNIVPSDVPLTVPGLATNYIASMGTGWNHTCAVTSTGALKCWGSNSSGQVGDNSSTNRFQAVDVLASAGPNVPLSGVAMVEGGRLHTCAVTIGGGVKCWGSNDVGQIGNGFQSPPQPPVLIPDNVISAPPPPDPAPPFTGAAAVAVGRSHSCLLTTGGGVKCWGYNDTFGLGDVAGSVQHITPADVLGLTSGVAGIAMHNQHTCARMTGNGLKCWGKNFSGQVGDNSTAERFTPVDVFGYAAITVQQVVVGEEHSCALAGGGVKCWGLNSNGQLGNNSTNPSSSPGDVTGLTSGVVAIAAGSFHTCAVTTEGAVKCWGRNDSGQVGAASLTDKLLPTDVLEFASGAAAVFAGENHTCALTTGGEVRCWGLNTSGQFGVSSAFTSESTPRSARIGPQRITFEPDATIPYGAAYLLPFAITTGNSSSLSTSFSDTWTPGTCTVGGGSATPVTLGLCGVRILVNGNSNYAPGSTGLRLVRIVAADQAISFAALPDLLSTAAPFVVSATGGGSGNAVTFTSLTPATCGTGAPTTATSATVTLTGTPGACTIAANQAANTNYNAAPQVTQSFAVLVRYAVVLEGAQEVPVNGALATGSGTVDVNTVAKTLTYSFTFSGLTGALADAHFHGPGARGVAAGVKIGIGASPNGNTVAYSPTDENDILTAKWYVNFHTATYPGGEIRGQLDNEGAAARQTLTVMKAGTGGGTVASNVLAPGIDCGGTCAFSYPQGLSVTLTAAPDGLSLFVGWSGGGCSGTGTCTVALGGATSVTATFDVLDTTPNSFSFTDVSNVARGSVQTSNAVTISGINTATAISVSGGSYSIGCTATFVTTASTVTSGQTVCVRHTASASGSTATSTTLNVGGVTDTFTGTTVATFTLSAATTGTGSGSVSGTGIACPGDCSEVVDSGTIVALTAAASAGSTFTGWSGGGCSGTSGCSVTVDADKTVTATFTLNTYTVTPSAGANGAITPSTAQTVNHGATTSFTVTANAGFAASVGGTCGGNLVGTTYTTSAITAHCTVSATFTQNTFTVTPSAGANGSISPSTPQSIAAGATTSFTVTPATGFEVDTVTGCGGALVGSTYTTGAINAACTVAATFKATNPPRLGNIATRMQVLTGADVMIAGFVIGGSAAKTVVVRARGPSLTAAGVPGALANPQLQLYSGSTQIGVNDNWADAPNAADLTASGFAPSETMEAALLVTLGPGAYTAIVTGVGATTGVAIVEVFEVDALTVPLINIATRGRVLTDANVMIGGFIIQGNGPQTVVVRARGPSLTAAGVPGALANPLLQLFSGSIGIAANDNWGDAANVADITASGFAPLDPSESAILMTLQPGAYTAIVTGVGGTTGVAIVEVFRVQ